jgi:peptidoglycan hydrolase-like protein with peptidoglycan-binding domain
MRTAGGIVLILSGLAVGVYAIIEPPQPDATLLNVRTAQQPVPHASEMPRSRLSFRQSASTEIPSSGWTQVIVTVPARGSSSRTSSQELAIPKDRDALARELQKELKRVGCYEGEVNGVWSPSTRRAMTAFMDRVNARLPVEKPDAILYAIVRGEREQVCGKACRVGEALTQDGRCVPAAILAMANRPTPPRAAIAPQIGVAEKEKLSTITGWSVTTTATVNSPSVANESSRPEISPIEGRMALAGPSPNAEVAAPTPASRPLHRGPPTVSPRFAGSGQSWSRVIFNPRISNN